jgi:hypothetical protein
LLKQMLPAQPLLPVLLQRLEAHPEEIWEALLEAHREEAHPEEI